MTRKNALRMCLVTFLLLSMAMVKVDAQQTKVYVNPKSSTVSDIGDVFTIDITVNDVNNFVGFEFKLFWNRTLLNVTDATYAVPDPSWTNPFWVPISPVVPLNNTYNATHGLFWLGCFDVALNPISGDFILASLTFQVMDLGSCTLNLRDTTLIDPEGKQIPHDTINGEVTTPKPKVYVNPKSSTVSDIGDVFTIDITVNDVNNFVGFEFKLFWNRTLLNVTDATYAVPDPSWTNPLWIPLQSADRLVPDYNATHGLFWLGCSNVPPIPISGDFILASLTFQVMNLGNCTLNLRDTKLVDPNLPWPHLIDHEAIDGEVTILGQPDDSSGPFSLVNVAIVIAVAVSFVAALYYVKKKIL